MGFLDDTIELIELAASGTGGAYDAAKAAYLTKYQEFRKVEDFLPVTAFIDDGSPGFEYPLPEKLLVPKMP